MFRAGHGARRRCRRSPAARAGPGTGAPVELWVKHIGADCRIAVPTGVLAGAGGLGTCAGCERGHNVFPEHRGGSGSGIEGGGCPAGGRFRAGARRHARGPGSPNRHRLQPQAARRPKECATLSSQPVTAARAKPRRTWPLLATVGARLRRAQNRVEVAVVERCEPGDPLPRRFDRQVGLKTLRWRPPYGTLARFPTGGS